VHIFAVNDPDEFAAKKIRHNIAHIKSLLEQNNIKCTDKVSIEKGGNFARQVISYADAIKADLIMIMTNREKLIPTFSLGPWDEQLIFNDSKIPVMCINPRDLNIPILKI
ncbi:MAG: universal stress protein, partial [Bacteroidota bacterium]